MYKVPSYRKKMQEDGFIAHFDNALTSEECKNIIAYFEEMKKYNLVFDRQTLSDGIAHHKKDETCFLFDPDTFYLDKTHPVLQTITDKLWTCYKDYAAKYSILMESAKHGISSMRVQKTESGGGYHDWHYESNGRFHGHRVLAFMLYLNTVNEGGETEFLYQKTRLNAVEGRFVIWPATFTHTHRGNPPLSGNKYIVTGWIEFQD